MYRTVTAEKNDGRGRVMMHDLRSSTVKSSIVLESLQIKPGMGKRMVLC